MPSVHSKLFVHAVPEGFVATQAGVELHQKPVAHPVLVAVGGVPVTLHVVAQAVPLAHAKFVGQAPVVPAVQVPVPVQVLAMVSMLPVHEAAAQTVPDAQSWQAPEPLQLPLLPQVDIAVAVHWLAGTGAVPAVTLPHVPSVPPVSAAEQAMHVPVQAKLQQTPLAQKPLAHCPAPVHAAPFGAPASIDESIVDVSFGASIDVSPGASIVDASITSDPESVIVDPSVGPSDEASIIDVSPPLESPTGPSGKVPSSSPPSCGILLRSKSTRSSHPVAAPTAPIAAATTSPHLNVRVLFIASFSRKLLEAHGQTGAARVRADHRSCSDLRGRPRLRRRRRIVSREEEHRARDTEGEGESE
jgi:hypothetical protein